LALAAAPKNTRNFQIHISLGRLAQGYFSPCQETKEKRIKNGAVQQMICPPLPLPTGAILLMHVGPRKTVFFVGKVVQIGGCKFGHPLTGIISQVSKLRSGLLIRQLCIPVFEITRICDESKSNICIPFTKAILGWVKNLKCCISVLFQTGTQKLTSSFHNLCYWNPI